MFGGVYYQIGSFSTVFSIIESPLMPWSQKAAHFYPVVLIAVLFAIEGAYAISYLVILSLGLLSVVLLPAVVAGGRE